MSQGDFTKANAQNAREAFGEIMKAFPKKKVPEFFGHFNEVALFLDAAERVAKNYESGGGKRIGNDPKER
jgi:hypothetical protein